MSREATPLFLVFDGSALEGLLYRIVGRRPSFSSEEWFNVTSMSDERYTLIDQASRNELGHFDSLAEAEETLARFLAHAPQAAGDLEIWDEDEDVRIEVDPATLRPAPAA